MQNTDKLVNLDWLSRSDQYEAGDQLALQSLLVVVSISAPTRLGTLPFMVYRYEPCHGHVK